MWILRMNFVISKPQTVALAREVAIEVIETKAAKVVGSNKYLPGHLFT